MSEPDRTLYVVTWQGPGYGNQYGPTQILSYDLDTDDPIATSEAISGTALTSVAYDYQGYLWAVGFTQLVQLSPLTLEVLSTPALPSFPLGSHPTGITFSNKLGYLWAAYLYGGGSSPETLTSCSFTYDDPEFDYVVTAVNAYGYYALNRDGPYTYYGNPWWVQTPLHGTKPYAFTLAVLDGNCVLVRMNLCPVVEYTGWEQVAVIGPESYGPRPIYPIDGYLGAAWWWDYAGPVVTPAGIYVLSNAAGTLNLYDLNTYALLKTWPYDAQCQNFAVDSLAGSGVAYMVNVATFVSDDGQGQSEIYALDLDTGEATLFAVIPCIFPAYIGNNEWSIPTYSSGPTVHIPLPSGPVTSCGTPWLRQFQRSDAGGVRMSQVAGSANSPLSIRNQSAGNAYT